MRNLIFEKLKNSRLIQIIIITLIVASCSSTNNIQMTDYPGHNHGSVEEEWLIHKRAPGWWYVTGILTDTEGKLYSYQLTILRAKSSVLYPYMLHLALTDFEKEKHYFSQEFQLSSKGIVVNDSTVQYSNYASIVKRSDGMYVTGLTNDFEFDLKLEYGKDPAWHCDDGYLIMGPPNSKGSTIYYSYTNMPTTGKVVLNGKEIKAKGKSWFDRQSGPYKMAASRNHWEWFSLRFDDDEEVMLFSFPQSKNQDGTYIPRDGQYQRLNNYTIETTDTVIINGLKYSSGWELTMPNIKDEKYSIVPIMKGQINGLYIEQLSKIVDKDKRQVGFCIVELLPGVYNEKYNAELRNRVKQKH